MPVKERTQAPAPTRAETPRSPTAARSPARSNRDNKKTAAAGDAATTVQRARVSVTMQQRMGNARVAQMSDRARATKGKQAPPTGPAPKVPVLSTTIALPAPASKPTAAKETRPSVAKGRKGAAEKEAKASAEKGLKVTREKETKRSAEKGLKPAPEKETAAATAAATVGTAAPIMGAAATAPAPEELAAAQAPTSETKTEEGKESKEAKPAGEKGEAKPTAGGEKKTAAPGEGGKEEGGAGGAAPVAVKLHLPEPPAEISPATKKRIGGVKKRASGQAKVHGDLPEGTEQVGDARQSVNEPDVEALAKAQAELINQVQAAPSPAIVELCERIREVIRNKRPPDEDALMKAEPEGEALEAGNQLNETVEGETKKVQDNYNSMNTPPAVAPEQGADLPPQPDTAETAPINAKAATPDAVPAENVSLDADVEDSQKKIDEAGMEKPTAKLAQSGPVAEARGAQGELEQTAKEDPAKVLAKQEESLAKSETDMAALQAEALAALTASRKGTAKKATLQQTGMVGSEESMRTKASKDAKDIFDTTQVQVNTLLKDLAPKAMKEWEDAKTILVSKFKADLAPVQARVDERHSGVGGFFVGVWDAVTGLPSWAEEGYANAERNFGDGVIAKLTEISTKVNSIILACEELIKSARERIKKIFDDLPESLRSWADKEQGKFDQQLDQLQTKVTSTRDNFNKELTTSAATAVDEVRAEIAALRKKAGGILGRIADAIGRFLDDPVKFIIEALLDLLGIPPATFWAVVKKIKQAISDIADDPEKFANNLFAGLGQGFTQFFDNFGKHMINGFIDWLTGGLASAGVHLPKDFSLKSIMTFFLELMGITWPKIRKILAKHLGEKNVALAEKVYSLLSVLIEKGPEGIFEMIKEKLDPQAIVDKIIEMAVDYMITAIIKAATARIIMLFNPVGAILQAIEAIYRVLKWVFQNAARIFSLIETIVNGIADIIAGSIGGFANAVEKALAKLIAPVIAFIADYLGFGDLPTKISETIKSFQEMILGFVEQALVWLIEKGKSLLAAMGIGKKEKKAEKGGTAHEQAVHEVAATLAEPPPGEPLTYVALRAAKEQEAQTLVAARNQSLAAENVRMSVTFVDRSKDQVDHDLDFSVRIAPNDAVESGATPAPVPEPVAGLHVVSRPAPFAAVAGESHHVPAKGLGSGVGQFLEQVASNLRSGEWIDDPAAIAVATAFSDRSAENLVAAAPPAEGLSAIVLCPEAHTEEGGVHTIEGSGPVLAAIAMNPRGKAIVQVKRRTQTRIGSIASYIAVNPQIASWRLFLADVHRAVDDPLFRNQHHMPPSTERAADLVLQQAEKEFMDADESSEQYLKDRVVDRTNAVLDRAVRDAYKSGKATVSASMDRANDGTPEGRRAALASLDGHYGASWAQFRRPIRV